MRKSVSKTEQLFDDYGKYCSFTDKNEVITVHYVYGKTKYEKVPRSFTCFSNPTCQNRDRCPLWAEYCAEQKRAQFRLAYQ